VQDLGTNSSKDGLLGLPEFRRIPRTRITLLSNWLALRAKSQPFTSIRDFARECAAASVGSSATEMQIARRDILVAQVSTLRIQHAPRRYDTQADQSNATT
jgi:hypothetical protein